jgi:transcriptional regulator with XRE-family HTH domain
MSAAPQLDRLDPSPLASARLHRKLTIDEAARRAGLSPEQIQWLEEGRVYRFPFADDALIAVVLYATALGIEQDEARALARLPVEPKPDRFPRTRIVSAVAAVVVLAALGVALLGGLGGSSRNLVGSSGGQVRPTQPLPPTWKLSVDVLNGRIGALGYKIRRVTKANRFDYPDTAVYFEPGGDAYGARLARQLGVQAKPLPGGSNPRRLVVIAGPPRVG